MIYFEEKFKFLSFGALKEVKITTRSVIVPPKMTEGTTPISFAATPDSKAPISFDDPMKTEFTE